MPLAIIRHYVENYEEWRPHFDRRENARQAFGITNAQVFRNSGDPNDLVLLFDVADESRLHFAESDDLRAIMKESGVDMETVVVGILP